MAEALTLVEWNVTHVSLVKELEKPDTPKGQCKAEDGEIAKWCSENGRVLVTGDEDFSGRWVRSGELAKHGVEVVVFDRELAGLRTQHERITRHLPHWVRALSAYPAGHRVWVQGERLDPRLQEGKRRRRRSRDS